MDLYMAHSAEMMCSSGVVVMTTQQKSAAEAVYQRRAEHLLTDDNCFKLTVVSHCTKWHSNNNNT